MAFWKLASLHFWKEGDICNRFFFSFINLVFGFMAKKFVPNLRTPNLSISTSKKMPAEILTRIESNLQIQLERDEHFNDIESFDS